MGWYFHQIFPKKLGAPKLEILPENVVFFVDPRRGFLGQNQNWKIHLTLIVFSLWINMYICMFGLQSQFKNQNVLNTYIAIHESMGSFSQYSSFNNSFEVCEILKKNSVLNA